MEKNGNCSKFFNSILLSGWLQESNPYSLSLFAKGHCEQDFILSSINVIFKVKMILNKPAQ
jgi:hypothetical protein